MTHLVNQTLRQLIEEIFVDLVFKQDASKGDFLIADKERQDLTIDIVKVFQASQAFNSDSLLIWLEDYYSLDIPSQLEFVFSAEMAFENCDKVLITLNFL